MFATALTRRNKKPSDLFTRAPADTVISTKRRFCAFVCSIPAAPISPDSDRQAATGNLNGPVHTSVSLPPNTILITSSGYLYDRVLAVWAGPRT